MSADTPRDGPQDPWEGRGAYGGDFTVSADLMDALALVAAVRHEDVAAVAKVVPVMDAYGVSIELARILGHFADQTGASAENWLSWCLKAARSG